MKKDYSDIIIYKSADSKN